jgi:hypothetical protein
VRPFEEDVMTDEDWLRLFDGLRRAAGLPNGMTRSQRHAAVIDAANRLGRMDDLDAFLDLFDVAREEDE